MATTTSPESSTTPATPDPLPPSAVARQGATMAGIAACIAYASLPDATIRALDGASRVRTYAPGEELCRQGDHVGDGDFVFFILRGKVAIKHRDKDGLERILRFRFPGEVIGEMALYEANRMRNATCVADETTEVRVVDYKTLGELANGPHHPELTRHLRDMYLERLIESRLFEDGRFGALETRERQDLGQRIERTPGLVDDGFVLTMAGAAIDHIYFVLEGATHVTASDGATTARVTHAERGEVVVLGLEVLEDEGHTAKATWAAMHGKGWVARLAVAELNAWIGGRDAIASLLRST